MKQYEYIEIFQQSYDIAEIAGQMSEAGKEGYRHVSTTKIKRYNSETVMILMEREVVPAMTGKKQTLYALFVDGKQTDIASYDDGALANRARQMIESEFVGRMAASEFMQLRSGHLIKVRDGHTYQVREAEL